MEEYQRGGAYRVRLGDSDEFIEVKYVRRWQISGNAFQTFVTVKPTSDGFHGTLVLIESEIGGYFTVEPSS